MQNNAFADNVVCQFKQFLKDKNIPETVLSDEEWASLTEMVGNAAPKFKGENDIDRANIVAAALIFVGITCVVFSDREKPKITRE